MQPFLQALQQLVDTVPAKLKRFSEADASVRSSPGKWSRKEELGHLLDSAANNHQRIVRTLLEDQPAMPGYQQERWVKLHNYQQRDWHELVDLWTALNRQLLTAASTVSDANWTRTCTVAGSQPLTLRFVVDDYVAHMRHHLDHIEAASHPGSY